MPSSGNEASRVRCSLCRRKFTSIEKLRRHEALSEMHRENVAKLIAKEREREAAMARSLTTCTVIPKPVAAMPKEASQFPVPELASASHPFEKKKASIEVDAIEDPVKEEVEDSKPKAKVKPNPKSKTRKINKNVESKKTNKIESTVNTRPLTRSIRAKRGRTLPDEKTQPRNGVTARRTRMATRCRGGVIEESKSAAKESKMNKVDVGSDVAEDIEPIQPPPPKRRRVLKNPRESSTTKALKNKLKRNKTASNAEKTKLTENAASLHVEDGVNLSFPEDTYYLTPVMCLIRSKCVEMFVATEDDVAARDLMGRPIMLGQVGVRCLFCRTLSYEQRATRSVSFPSEMSRLYNVLLKMQSSHFTACSMVPPDILAEYNALKSANANRCKASSKYVTKAAIKAGAENYAGGNGICFSDTKVKPDIDAEPSSGSVVSKDNEEEEKSSQYNEIYCKKDKHLVTDFVRLIMLQYQICSYDDSYYIFRKEKYLREGYPGLTCKFCAGKPDECRIFWPTPNRMSENFEIAHDHLMECKLCPEEIKNQLLSAKANHSTQLKEKEHWFLKAYYTRIWEKMFRTVAEERFDFSATEKIGTRGNAAASANKVLACKNDEDHLPPLDCFIRRNVQLFRASPRNTPMQPSEVSRISINTLVLPGQVGMRCIHCAEKGVTEQIRWPSSVEEIAQTARLMYVEHLSTCPNLPSEDDARRKLMRAEKFDRSAEILDYYFTSASVDTELVDSMILGVRYVGDKGALLPPLIDGDDEYGLVPKKIPCARKKVEPAKNPKEEKKRQYTEEDIDDSARAILATAWKEAKNPLPDALISDADFQYMTNWKLLLMHQLRSCQFTPEDRTTSNRYKIRNGFHGLCCKHCCSGNTFPPNVKALGKNAIANLYQHLRNCPKCPPEIKHALVVFRTTHLAEVEELEYNSQTILAKNVYRKMIADAKRASKA